MWDTTFKRGIFSHGNISRDGVWACYYCRVRQCWEKSSGNSLVGKMREVGEGYRVLVALKVPADRRNCQESLPRLMHQCNGSAGEGPWWMRVHAVGDINDCDINDLVMSTLTCSFPTSHEFGFFFPSLSPMIFGTRGKDSSVRKEVKMIPCCCLIFFY